MGTQSIESWTMGVEKWVFFFKTDRLNSLGVFRNWNFGFLLSKLWLLPSYLIMSLYQLGLFPTLKVACKIISIRFYKSKSSEVNCVCRLKPFMYISRSFRRSQSFIKFYVIPVIFHLILLNFLTLQVDDLVNKLQECSHFYIG